MPLPLLYEDHNVPAWAELLVLRGGSTSPATPFSIVFRIPRDAAGVESTATLELEMPGVGGG